MRTPLSKPLFFGAVFAAALLAPSTSFGQAKGIGKVAADKLPSPEVQIIGKNKNFRAKDWMEAELELKLPGTPEQKKIGFYDMVTIKWHVAFKNPENKTQTIKLEKDVTHLNVPIDEQVFVSIYLSPNTIHRLTGNDRFNPGEIVEVTAEVVINGKSVGDSSLKGAAAKWYESPTVADMSSKFPLLNKNETPFKGLWWDRYAEIEEKH